LTIYRNSWKIWLLLQSKGLYGLLENIKEVSYDAKPTPEEIKKLEKYSREK